MNEDMVKGFMLGGLHATAWKDKERHLEATKTALGEIVQDKDLEALLDELIEEGWVNYNEEGNNIQTSSPEGVST